MKTVVVISTYWGRPSNESYDSADAIYDHPTPLDQEGTLARALNSFKVSNRKDFEIVVVGAATNPALEAQAERKICDITQSFKRDLDVSVLSHSSCERLKEKLGWSDDRRSHLISLYGYSNILNLCLVAGLLRDAEAVVLFDDDEVVEDPDYITRCTEHIGKEIDGQTMLGIAGWYKRPNGGYLCPRTKDWWWMEWCGAEAMNKAFRMFIGRGPRIKKTPFAFGGNMVIHRDIYTRIPFDPKITRGEDIDYVFNAAMFGYDFYLDNELWIKHMPPKGHTPDWLGFRQNVLRFTYARQKLKSQVEIDGMRIVRAQELDPYPGFFMGDDLDAKIFNTSSMLGLHYLLMKNDKGYQESMKNIELASRLVQEETDPIGDYLKVKNDWGRLVSELEGLRNKRDLLVE